MTTSAYPSVYSAIAAYAPAQTHPSNAVTAVSALTKSYTGAGGVQVSCWPGWWDGSSTPTTDAGGSGTNIRTNQTGARITVQVTGTKIFGVRFDSSIWDAENYGGSQWIPRPSFWCYRITTDGVAGSWVYGVRASASPGGWIFANDLVTTSVYLIEIEPTHITDPINATSNSGISILDFVREPQLTGTSGYPVNEQGAFQQINGFVTTTGATFQNITFAQTALNVMVYGDSNTHGYVLAGTDATVDVSEVGSVSATLELDARGHRITFVRQVLETYATAQNKRLVICNSSYGGLWLGVMQNLVRQGYAAPIPSGYNAYNLSASPINRLAKRHGWTSYLAPNFTEEARPLPSGWTPDVAVIALVTNDQVISEGLIGAGQSGAVVQHHSDSLFRDDAVAFVQAIRAQWTSCKVFAINNHLSDSIFVDVPGVNEINTHGYFNAAVGVGYLDLSATSWGRAVDLRALVSTTTLPDARASTHMTPVQHTACASAIQSTFNTLMAL